MLNHVLSTHASCSTKVAAGNPLPLTQGAIPLVGHAFEARIYAENPRNNFLPDSGRLLYLSTPTPTTVFAQSIAPRSLADSSEELTPLVSDDAVRQVQPSVRVEQGFLEGADIGVFYDPMIAKLVVHARDRLEALRVLRTALEDYRIAGLSTNISFLRQLAGNENFCQGEVETGFIKVRMRDHRLHLPTAGPDIEHRNISTNFSQRSRTPAQRFSLKLRSF